MALPATFDPTVPSGTEDISLGDDRIRAVTLAIVDAFGIPAATAVANAIMNVTAAGLKNVVLQDAASDPVAAGQLQRNGSLLKFHSGAGGVVTLATAAAPGGSIALAGTLRAPGTNGQYTTSSPTYTDVDITNLKATVNVPAGAKFILVWGVATLTCPANTIGDAVDHVSVLAAGTRVAQTGFISTGVFGGVNVFNDVTLFGVVANPPSGSRTIAMQFRGQTSGPPFPVTIQDKPVQWIEGGAVGTGGQYNLAQLMYVVTT